MAVTFSTQRAPFISNLQIKFVRSETVTVRKGVRIVGSGDGDIWLENEQERGMSIDTGAHLRIGTDERVRSQPRLGSLYIADHEVAVEKYDASGTVTAGVLDSNGVDWVRLLEPTKKGYLGPLGSGLSDDKVGDNYFVEVISPTSPTGGAGTSFETDGDYENGGVARISSIAAAGITLCTMGKYETAAANLTGGCTCNFRVVRSPKVYQPSVTANDSLQPLTTPIDDSDDAGDVSKGFPPVGCELVSLYRDRLVWAGDPLNEHLWYMSRLGDPKDYHYGAPSTDAERAVAGSSTDAGRIGEPVKALIPVSDDYFIFGCRNSMWLLRGDPAFGGIIDNLSRSVGVVSGDAFAIVPGGRVYFLSDDGLYRTTPSQNEFPTPISRNKVPGDLLLAGIDPARTEPLMLYDVQSAGIHIFLSPRVTSGELDGVVNHYWFDIENESFWPVTINQPKTPTVGVVLKKDRSATDAVVLLAGEDSQLREFGGSSGTDDGDTIPNEIWIGPIGAAHRDTLLHELYATMAEEGPSGAITWQIFASDSPEGALDQPADGMLAYGTFGAGANYTAHPRVRGRYLYVKLIGADRDQWSFENIAALVDDGGRARKL